MGKEWTTVGPDSEIKLVGVSAASTVIVSLCVCQSGATGLRGALTRTPARFFSEIHIFQKVSYTVKKTSWGADTHTRDTWAHTSSRITQNSPRCKNLTRPQLKNHPNSPTHPHDRTTARPREDRIRGRFNSRSPGAERSPRPTTGRYGPGSPGVFLPVQYRYCPVCVHPAPPGVFTGPGC